MKNVVTGLDVGTDTIRVVVTSFASSAKDGAVRPEIMAAVSHPSRGMRHGYVKDVSDVSSAIAEAIAKAEKIAGFRIKEVFLGIGGISVESSIINSSVAIASGERVVSAEDLRRLKELSEKSINERKNREILHAIPLGYKLDGHHLYARPLGMEGSQLASKTHYITVLKQHFEDIVSSVEKAGLKVDDVAVSVLGTSMVALTKAHKTAGCLLANLGAETVSLIVFEENLPISVATFQIGGTSITNDLALGLKVPIEEAESIKLSKERLTTAQAKKKIDEIIGARLKDIFEAVGVYLRKLGKDGLLPAGIVLTGGTSSIDGIELLAKSSLLLPSRRLISLTPPRSGTPLHKDTASPRSAESEKGVGYATAYGLTLIGQSKGTDEESMGMDREQSFANTLLSWFKQFLP